MTCIYFTLLKGTVLYSAIMSFLLECTVPRAGERNRKTQESSVRCEHQHQNTEETIGRFV